jgi:hypothetical protein
VRILLVSLVASGVALAQVPRVGLVELYGVHNVSAERIRAAVGVGEGDPLPTSKAEIEERLEKVPGVVLARVQAVCCNGDRAVLYVGTEERDAPHVEFRRPPQGTDSLPEALSETYHDFIAYFGETARTGEPSGPAAAAYEENFRVLAANTLDSLHQVLRESNDAEQRATAAYILGRAPATQAVVDDLQYAMLDDDETVRANAMRSLVSIWKRLAGHPHSNVRIEPTWFIELLNSLVWDDRWRAADSLAIMTVDRNPSTLQSLRERALPALADMARWRTPAHARPAFLLLGRVAGLAEKQIEDAWKRGDRESVIRRALEAKPAPEE